MPNEQLPQQIADLLLETGQAHHQAYLETDGADPEWPLWYAEYLQEKLGRLLDHEFTRSELTYQIVHLDKAYTSRARIKTWAEFYAQELIEAYLP
ncbi:MAG: hypothetical protein WAM60_10775 [Candidatus Promineifilaceae bacterium]